jgi:hypothetical protein
MSGGPSIRTGPQVAMIGIGAACAGVGALAFGLRNLQDEWLT